jgi:hypothetical protein
VSIESEQDQRRARAISVDAIGWRKLSTREKVQTYSDGQFLPCSAEWLDRLFSPTADTEYVADFRERYPTHYLLARALHLELTAS